MNQFQKTYCSPSSVLNMGKWPSYFSCMKYVFSTISFGDESEIDEIPVCMGSMLETYQIKSRIKQQYHQTDMDSGIRVL